MSCAQHSNKWCTLVTKVINKIGLNVLQDCLRVMYRVYTEWGKVAHW